VRSRSTENTRPDIVTNGASYSKRCSPLGVQVARCLLLRLGPEMDSRLTATSYLQPIEPSAARCSVEIELAAEVE
jgi:hypothetical protein